MGHFILRPKKISPPMGTPYNPGWDHQEDTRPSLCLPPHRAFPSNLPRDGSSPLKLPLILLRIITIVYCINHTDIFQLVYFLFQYNKY